MRIGDLKMKTTISTTLQLSLAALLILAIVISVRTWTIEMLAPCWFFASVFVGVCYAKKLSDFRSQIAARFITGVFSGGAGYTIGTIIIGVLEPDAYSAL